MIEIPLDSGIPKTHKLKLQEAATKLLRAVDKTDMDSFRQACQVRHELWREPSS